MRVRYVDVVAWTGWGGSAVNDAPKAPEGSRSAGTPSLADAVALFESRCPAFVEHPAEALGVIRSEAPVLWSDALNGLVLTRYDDVTAVLRDAETFSSVGTMTAHVSIAPEAVAILGEERSQLRNFLANVDSPRHERLRSAIAHAFTPRGVAGIEPRARDTARRLASDLAGAIEREGAVDFIECFAARYPVDVVGAFIGVPVADRDDVPAWVGDWFRLYRFRLTTEEQIACAQSVRIYGAYVNDLIEMHRRMPVGDEPTVIGTLVDGVTRGQIELSDDELADLVANLIVGGIHTTSSALGAVMLRLLSTTGAWQQLVERPDLIGSAVEECLRLEGIAIGGARVARHDVVLHGHPVAAGQMVRPVSRAADLDPAVFEDPLSYMPDRANVRRHLVFGHGPHVCIGAPLARLELTCAIRVLTESLPGLALAASHRTEYLASPTHRQLARLLVSAPTTPPTISRS